MTEFDRFFANVGLILAKQIPERKNTFESYLVKDRMIVVLDYDFEKVI